MKIDAIGISKGRNGHALPQCSVSMASGSARMVLAETAQRPTVLGLILSGRMRPDTGTLLLNGHEDRRGIRRRVALVDAPVVSEPHGDVTVAEVTAEELAFAGQRSHPIAVNRMLEELGVRAQANTTIADLTPAARIRLLTELAARRPDIAGVVIVSPDRHGGEPEEWWRIALDFAARGLAVMVIAGAAARSALDAGPTPAHRGETDEVVPLPAALSGAGLEATNAEPPAFEDEQPSMADTSEPHVVQDDSFASWGDDADAPRDDHPAHPAHAAPSRADAESAAVAEPATTPEPEARPEPDLTPPPHDPAPTRTIPADATPTDITPTNVTRTEDPSA